MKCTICSKKVTIANAFKCGCDNTKNYCGTHRYPEEHKCILQPKKVELVKIQGEKLIKI
jgi:predicted nucleic acid binding AN1-type Zn finger protein